MSDYKFPTETIELPSKGLVYGADHPLANGVVDVKYMTGKEEDMLSSENLISKGLVMNKIYESVMVHKDVNPDDLIVGDRDAVIVASRVISFGPDYSVIITCPSCNERNEVTVDLSQVEPKPSMIEDVTENKFTFVTPKGKNKIEFKLLTHGDETKLTKELETWSKLNKNSDINNESTLRHRYTILSVDGNSDKLFIKKWVETQFIVADSRAFRKHINELSPALDLTFDFGCRRCNHTDRLNIPIGIEFLWPST